MKPALQSRLCGAAMLLLSLGFTYGARHLAATTGRYSFKMVLFGGVLLPLGLWLLCLAPPVPVSKENKSQFVFAALGLFLGECHWFFLTGSWSPFVGI